MTRTNVLGAAGLVVLAAMAACGGGGGSGGSGTTISGNVASASTTSLRRSNPNVVVRLFRELTEVVPAAYAQANTLLTGIHVTVAAGMSSASADTDDLGTFRITNAPTGDVTVTYQRGTCAASIPANDVEDRSTLDLKDATLNCNSVTVKSLDEEFTGVLENKPASQNGNLNVCSFGGNLNHVRAVSTDTSTAFADASGASITFDTLQPGDSIEVSGPRAGVGASSAVSAKHVTRLASGQPDKCQVTPTP